MDSKATGTPKPSLAQSILHSALLVFHCFLPFFQTFVPFGITRSCEASFTHTAHQSSSNCWYTRELIFTAVIFLSPAGMYSQTSSAPEPPHTLAALHCTSLLLHWLHPFRSALVSCHTSLSAEAPPTLSTTLVSHLSAQAAGLPLTFVSILPSIVLYPRPRCTRNHHSIPLT